MIQAHCLREWLAVRYVKRELDRQASGVAPAYAVNRAGNLPAENVGPVALPLITKGIVGSNPAYRAGECSSEDGAVGKSIAPVALDVEETACGESSIAAHVARNEGSRLVVYRAEIAGGGDAIQPCETGQG